MYLVNLLLIIRTEELYMKKFVCILLIFVLMFALASVVLADDVVSPEKGNTDVDPQDNPAAPQTGETGAIYWVVAAMLFAVGTVIFCGKKLVAQK